MSSDIIYRRYKPGDEDGIVSTVDACFDTFRDFGLDRDLWLRYEKMDPGFKKENALVAEHAGKIVGHVQLVQRGVKLGDQTFVQMGGIANVSTIPEMRGRGVSTALMVNAVDLCRKEGLPLSGLFTGYGSVAHRIYRRVGFASTLLCGTALVGTGDEMRRVKEICNEVSGVKIRNYERGDEKEMLNIYREWSNGYTGVVERSLDYWKKKLVDISSTHTFFYEDFDPSEVYVTSEDGEITGYAYITLWKRKRKPYRSLDTASIREIVFKPGHIRSFMKLVNSIMDVLLSEDIRVCEMFAPDDESYSTVFKHFKRMGLGDSIYMVHVPLIDRFLHEIRGDLEKRLSVRPEVASNITLQFQTPYGNSNLRIQGGELKLGGDEPTATIFFDEDSFTRMIFGIETMDEFVHGDTIRIHTSEPIGKVISVVRALFPKRIWFTCPVDSW